MQFHEGRRYLDDRLFILHLTVAEKAGQRVWAVVTRRNCEGFPPFRVDEFKTQEEATSFVRKIEPTTPRHSLGGRAPDPPPSHEQYLQWLRDEGLPSSLEFSNMNTSSFGSIIIEQLDNNA